MVATLTLIGTVTAAQPIAYAHGSVTVGNGPTNTVIFVDRRVMGSLYGHAFRKYVATNGDEFPDGSYCFVETSRDLPLPSPRRVIVSGDFAREPHIISKIARGTQMIIVNPACSPDEGGWDVKLIGKATVYFGEYSQAPSRSTWSNVRGIKALQIDGASDFVPSWPQIILSSSRT